MKKIYQLQFLKPPGVWSPTGIFDEEMKLVQTDEMAKRLADLAGELNPPHIYRAIYRTEMQVI